MSDLFEAHVFAAQVFTLGKKNTKSRQIKWLLVFLAAFLSYLKDSLYLRLLALLAVFISKKIT
jgi:hypothetical protein